jgi:WD40 repeat protein
VDKVISALHFQLSLCTLMFGSDINHLPTKRSMRMTGDTIITGSDDWTARVWSLNRGTCDAVLACHAGPILCVEYSPSDKGIITGM